MISSFYIPAHTHDKGSQNITGKFSQYLVNSNGLYGWTGPFSQEIYQTNRTDVPHATGTNTATSFIYVNFNANNSGAWTGVK